MPDYDSIRSPFIGKNLRPVIFLTSGCFNIRAVSDKRLLLLYNIYIIEREPLVQVAHTKGCLHLIEILQL